MADHDGLGKGPGRERWIEKGVLLVSWASLWTYISKYIVPLTLVHGNLNAVDLILNGREGFTFIDAYTWISSPFLNALSFWTVSEDMMNRLISTWNCGRSSTAWKGRETWLVSFVSRAQCKTSGMSLRFYLKANAGLVRCAQTGLISPPCSRFSGHN